MMLDFEVGWGMLTHEEKKGLIEYLGEYANKCPEEMERPELCMDVSTPEKVDAIVKAVDRSIAKKRKIEWLS